MNFEFFIARRINSAKENKNAISRPITNIAIVGVALSVAVILVSIAVVTGFKHKIRSKVIGFGSHIQIVNYDANNSYESAPIPKNQPFYPQIDSLAGIQHIQTYASKPGIIKTKNNIQGVLLKGVDSDFKWDFFKKNLVKGDIFRVSDTAKTNKILVSKTIASLLQLEVDDAIAMFFVQDPPRMRKFKISGIYQTSLKELDKLFVIGDIKHVQKLNNWNENQITGFEILINDFDQLKNVYSKVNNQIGYEFDQNGNRLKVVSINQEYPQIFDWLNLLDMNVLIILILMIVVAGINMVSGLLIIILERTNMIGILKALGSENHKIRNIFLYQAGFIIFKGMIWGNLIGISLCLIQKYFDIITLNPETYYLSFVPINLDVSHILALNVGALVTIILIMLLPSVVISKISPMKTIRFE